MLNILKPNKRGFTIIEVVIVLAIAGLIFAVVFIAVPQLQAAQRDQARQDAMGRFQAAANQYKAHGGPAPHANGGINVIRDRYMDGEFADPIGGQYSYNATPSYEDAHVRLLRGRVCHSNGRTDTRTGAGQLNYALSYELEQGGRQCVDNT